MDLTVGVGESACEIRVILNFLIIPIQNAFRGVLGKSFLAKLDAVASPVHLKVTYHDADEGRSQ